MINTRDIYNMLKPMSEYEKKRIEKYGIRVTNPTSPTNTLLYAHNWVEKKQPGLSAKELENVEKFYRNVHKKASKSDIEIWRNVTSNFYGVYPQEAISNFREFLWQGEQASFFSFDMETLGGLNESARNYFTPTEISFNHYQYVDGKLQRVGSRNYTIAPSQKVLREWEGIVKTVKSGGQLDPDQYRTLTDLMKYSGEGQGLGVRMENGRIVQHAKWVEDLIKQEGVIDFRKTYYVNGRQIKPIEEVEKGIKFLTKQQNPVDVARDFAQFITENPDAFYAGQNIRNFDNRSLIAFITDNLSPEENQTFVNNFLSRKFIDTQQVASALYQSPVEMLKDFGVEHMINEINEGYLTQDTLAKITGTVFEGQAHVADVDSHTLAQILDKSKSIFGKRIEELDKTPVIGVDGKIKYQPEIGLNATGYGFDTRGLKRGERLISLSGAGGIDDSTIGFVVDQSGNVQNRNNYLMSKVSYRVNDFYEVDHNSTRMYGVELLNEATGEKHIIYKKSKAELQNFMQEKFRVTDGLSDEAIDYMNKFKAEDLGRSRYRKLFSTREGGGYWATSRMVRAVEVERDFKSGKINKQERDTLIGSIFSIDGKPVESLVRDYEALKDRLDSEYEILKPVISEIEKQLEINPYEAIPIEKNLKASIALTTTYEEMLARGLSEHREVIKTPEFGKYGFTFYGRNGEELFLNLESPATTEASLHGILNKISHSFGNDITMKKEYLIHMVENQLGAQLDLSEYEIRQAVKTIERISKNQKGTGYEVGEFAAFLNKIKKEKDIFRRDFIEVESLSPRRVLELSGEDAFQIVNQKLQEVKNMQDFRVISGNKKSSLLSFDVVNELDDSLNQLYDAFGFTKKRPKTMQQSLNEFLEYTWQTIRKSNSALDMRLINTGSPSNPQLTLQIFNTLNRGVYGNAVDNSLNAVNVRLPLISKEGYIQFGKIKRIAPLAFIDRQSTNLRKVEINTAFDRILHQLETQMDIIVKLTEEGRIDDANSRVNKIIREAIESLSSSKYGEDINLDVTGSAHADFLKRLTVHTGGFFDPLGGDGTWYDEKGNVIWLSEKAKAVKDIPQLVKKHLGDSVEVYWASSKSGEALKGVAPLIDIRHDFALGFYNDAGRDNMIQYWNNKILDDLSYDKLRKNKNVHVGMLFGPEHMASQETALVKVRIMDDADLLRIFGDQYDSIASLPTVAENQFVIVDSLAKSMESRRTFTKQVEGKFLPTLSEDLLDYFVYNEETDRLEPKSGTAYKVGYMEELFKYRDANYADTVEGNLLSGRFTLQGDNYLLGIRVLDDGGYEFEFENIFRVEKGTKYFVGTEKGIVSEILDDASVARRVGEDISVIANSEWIKHKSYGEVFEGYINNALFEINKLDGEIKKEKAKDIANLVSEIFNIDAVVVIDDQGVVSIQYDSYKMVEKAQRKLLKEAEATGAAEDIVRGYGSFIDDINKILSDVGIRIREDELMLPVHLANVDMNFHLSNLGEEALGLRGAKFSIQEVQSLRLRGFHEQAEWLEKMILSDVSDRTRAVARDEANVLRYLLLDEGIPEDTLRVKNIEGRWRKLREGHVEGILGFEKGLYTREALKGTLIDPEREAFILELPEPVLLDLDDRNFKQVNEILIGRVDPRIIEDSGLYPTAGLPRYQLNIIEAIEKYNQYHSGQEVLNYYGKVMREEDILNELQRSVQEYYDFIKVDLTGNKGLVYDNVYTGRLFGSGGGLLHVMNPIPELADDLKDIIDIDEDLLNKFTNQVQDPNVVFISREQALRMAGFNSIKEFEEALRKVEISDAGDELIERVNIIQNMQGQGHHGLLVRYPTIHRHSVDVVKFQVDDSLEPRATKLSAILTKALYGDSDGDRTSYVLASGDYNYDKWEEALKKNAQLLIDEFKYGEGGTLESVRKSILQGTPIEELLKSDTIPMRIGKAYDDLTFVSKNLNPLYTGRLTNIGLGALQLGEVLLTDPQDIKHLQEGIGALIQTSLSGKHLSAKDEAMSAIETINEVIKIISEGSLDPSGRATSLHYLVGAKIGDKRLFTQEQVDAFIKLRQLAGAEMWNSVSTELGLSEKVSRRSYEDFVNLLTGQNVAPTTNLEYMLRIVGLEAEADGIKKMRDEIQQQAAVRQAAMSADIATDVSQQMTDTSAIQKAIRTQTEETGATIIRRLRSRMSGKVSLLGVGAALAGGFVAGSMLAADRNLPMDFIDAPGMRPRGSSPTYSSYNYVPGVSGTGYDINISAMTTIDKNIEQLAGVVAQSMYNTTSLPMNININATDNRNDISQNWIQEQVLKAINA